MFGLIFTFLSRDHVYLSMTATRDMHIQVRPSVSPSVWLCRVSDVAVVLDFTLLFGSV